MFLLAKLINSPFMMQEIQLIGSTKLMRGDRINKGALFKTAEIDKKKQENAIARLE
jgi:hypothetical protein